MRKLITESPKGMVEHAHNFVFAKDNEVYVRLADEEISLVEYIRRMDKEIYGIEHDDSYCNALEFGEYMDEDRFTCDMYHALVGFAEVRNYLKYYEEKLGEAAIEEITETKEDKENYYVGVDLSKGKDITVYINQELSD